MNVDNELTDYGAAGSLAEELPWWGWLEDGRSCLTRAGELMSIGRMTPSVLDGQTPEQLDRVIDRWQRMLSGVDSRTRLYFYLLRRPIQFPEVADGGGVSNVVTLGQRKRRAFLSERVQDVSAYIAWTHDPGLSTVAAARTGGPRWMAYVKNWMARRRNAHESVYLLSAIETAGAAFRQTVDASRALVDDLTPLRLLKAHEASEVLSELTNRPGTPWDGATGSGMNWRLAVSELEAERRNLRLDGEPVVLYSLLSPPGSARSNLLSDLYRLDATLTVTLEWRPQRLDSARRKIRGAQRHYFSKRYSMSAHVQETEGSAAAMVDTAAAAESDRLGDALVELETDGVAYGDLALTIAIHGPLEHSESLDGDIRRIFASHDAKVIREGYGQLPAWFSRMPGQPRRRQVRSVFVSAGVAACMAPIFGPPVGTPQSGHLRAAALAILETQWRTPYHYDLFQGDVGHTLVLGATGAGKSFALNFLLVQALQYDPRILILDLGGSYRWLTQFLGGGYMELSPAAADGEGFQLRPFSLPAKDAGAEYAEIWGEAIHANRHLRTITVGLGLAVLLLIVVVIRIASVDPPRPIVVRVDEIGRAEAVAYDVMEAQADPLDPTTKYFLNRFVYDFYSRRRATVEENWSRSLRFLTTDLANASFRAESQNIALLAAGAARDELQVDRVVLRIQANPQEPHSASADFDLVRLVAEGEVDRERWSLSLQFLFLDEIPPDLIVHNPMGIVITYLQGDRAVVTGER